MVQRYEGYLTVLNKTKKDFFQVTYIGHTIFSKYICKYLIIFEHVDE